MKVKFVPQNIELEIRPDQTVLNLAQENKIEIRSVCNGMPSCAECRVRVVDGEYNVAPPSRKELNLIGTGYFIDQRRLSCQLYCYGDVTIDLSEQLEMAKEGNVPKKFLARANKERAEDYNSVGGVLIEQDDALLKQAEAESKSQAERRPQANQQQRTRGEQRPRGQQQRPPLHSQADSRELQDNPHTHLTMPTTDGEAAPDPGFHPEGGPQGSQGGGPRRGGGHRRGRGRGRRGRR